MDICYWITIKEIHMTSDDFKKVDILLEDSNYSFVHSSMKNRIDTSQPKNSSWVSVDAELTTAYAIEQKNIIDYRDAEEMAAELKNYINWMASPELMQLVREGTIQNLTFRIGPISLSSTDLNWENGIDKLVFDNTAKKSVE
jgi:hypothetical protein